MQSTHSEWWVWAFGKMVHQEMTLVQRVSARASCKCDLSM